MLEGLDGQIAPSSEGGTPELKDDNPMPLLLEHPIQHLLSRLENATERTIIGMAGLPGSGKSTLAAHLAEEVNAHTVPNTMIALGMDGFHLTKAQLSQMPNPAESLARRGAPWTFDALGFFQRLQQLREQSRHEMVPWPDFQHEIGDPVENAYFVLPKTRLILVEGLYLLHDVDGWQAIRQSFDEVWYLDTPWDVAMERLAQRHIKAWGLTRDEAEARIASNDALNAKLVLQSRSFAQWDVLTS